MKITSILWIMGWFALAGVLCIVMNGCEATASGSDLEGTVWQHNLVDCELQVVSIQGNKGSLRIRVDGSEQLLVTVDSGDLEVYLESGDWHKIEELRDMNR